MSRRTPLGKKHRRIRTFFHENELGELQHKTTKEEARRRLLAQEEAILAQAKATIVAEEDALFFEMLDMACR